MSSVILALVGIAIILAGYVLYSKYLSQRVYKLSPSFTTPSREFTDGVDYVPTNKFVLWGHHFTSVAGAAPIVGPAVAVIWGWLPAFLWVTLGTVFFAGMHDLGALWASVRNKGQSVGTLSGRYIGSRGRNLFLVVIFLLLLMVNAVFAVVIAQLLVAQPTAVIPVWGAIVVAVLIGQAIYRLKWNLPVVSVVGVVALYALILLGDRFPVELPDTILGLSTGAFWIIVLFLYAGVASTLPVWMLLQPRDYINGLQLFIGLGILFAAILISAPTIVAPAVNGNVPPDTPNLVPLLFVTIACGAVSGAHGLIASGTSSKQLDKETDARFVGYFGAVGEGLLALGTIIVVTAGFETLAGWQENYAAFDEAGVVTFITSGGSILNDGLGLPASLSATILATMAVLFAATTMDTGVRLQRYIVEEIGGLMGVRFSTLVATVIAVVLGLGLAFGADMTGSGQGGMVLWPLFGTTNQLLAALTLSIITVMLVRKRRPYLPVLLPLLFVLVMTIYAALVQVVEFYNEGNWLLLGMDLVILVAAAWVVVESAMAIGRARNEEPEPEDEVAEAGARDESSSE